jgi:hypothetical protein
VTRTLGHLPDTDIDIEQDLAHRHVGRLVGAVRPRVAREVNMLGLLDRVLDQGSMSACVGFALSSVLYLRAKIAGWPIDRPSALAIYTLARLADDFYGVLVDAGSRPRRAMLALTSYGLVAEQRWPALEANVNTPLPLDVFQHGDDALLTDWYRIPSGRGAAVAVRESLARGFPVAFAMPVDAAYQNHDGRAAVSSVGDIVGQHYQAFVGYRDAGLVVLNSWSSNWGNEGTAVLSDAFVDAHCTDILVPTVIPAKVS